MPDITISNHGSVFGFELHTERARSWIDENVETEEWQWQGGFVLCVDSRFAGQLAEGMQAAGLEVA